MNAIIIAKLAPDLVDEYMSLSLTDHEWLRVTSQHSAGFLLLSVLVTREVVSPLGMVVLSATYRVVLTLPFFSGQPAGGNTTSAMLRGASIFAPLQAWGRRCKCGYRDRCMYSVVTQGCLVVDKWLVSH